MTNEEGFYFLCLVIDIYRARKRISVRFQQSGARYALLHSIRRLLLLPVQNHKSHSAKCRV